MLAKKNYKFADPNKNYITARTEFRKAITHIKEDWFVRLTGIYKL
jgi:hypothetical protein